MRKQTDKNKVDTCSEETSTGTTMASDPSGHDKNFLEAPPDELTCLICHCVARDPLQTQCCGKLYCKSCLERLRQNEGTCPTCRKRRFSTFSDHISYRRIKALKLACDNEDKGCKWTGELAQLERHIAAECMFAEVPCRIGCFKTLLRCNMQEHLERECPLREYKCPLCKEWGKYHTMTREHLRQCPNLIIACPNVGCHVRKAIPEIIVHRKTCPKEKVSCSYFEVGCDVYHTRETLEQHETECMQRHLQLAMKKMTSMQAVSASLQAVTSIPPQVFKMSDFRNHKEEEKRWYTPFFYSHQGGYRMSLCVFANGQGDAKGTHISAFVYVNAGENDDKLVWPFRGEVTFGLLNQLANSGHFTTSVGFEEEEISASNQRPADGKRTSGRGYPKVIEHGQLEYNSTTNCQYLKDDCLYIRVSSVDVYDSNKPWLSTYLK